MLVLPRAVVLLTAAWLLGCARSGPPVRPIDDPPRPPSAKPAPAPRHALSAADLPPDERGSAEAAEGPGWLGVELALRSPELPGVTVRAVVPGSPAERAGLASGDVIVSIQGESVSRPAEVVVLIAGRSAGERVGVLLLRGEQEKLVSVTLEALPSEEGMLKKRFEGGLAPALASLETVQGSLNPSLNELRGKVVVIEFWATWCVPCRITAPLLSSWHDRYGAQGLRVLGVTGEPVVLAADAARHGDMTYPLFSDETGATTRAYRAFALPTLFVVDRQGTVRDVMVGFSAERLRQIEGLIETLLAER